MLVTLGIKPHYPETGFGYIKTAEVLEPGFKVEKFVEKPSLPTARKYVASGEYFWNGGIFTGKISVFLQEFARFAPEIAALAAQCSFADDKIDENYDTKTEVAQIRKSAVEFKIKKNEKLEKTIRIK